MKKIGFSLLALGVIGCDQGTKWVAARELMGRPMQSFWADTFRLVYAENLGGFLGLGSNFAPWLRTAIFSIATGFMLGFALWLLWKSKGPLFKDVGLTLFVAGGFSNWIDRLYRGNVIDFMNMGIGDVRTGIFNVADMAIMAGLGCLLISEFGKKQDPHLETPRIP